jgi:hypothetical protein
LACRRDSTLKLQSFLARKLTRNCFDGAVDEERGAVKIKESDRFLAPETLAAMVLT